MKKVVFIFTALLLWSCHSKNNDVFTVKTFPINDGWGYTINKNNKVLIKQSVIPSLTTNSHFKNEPDAFKVGNLVKERISKNLSPSISGKDLILLKIKL